MKKINWLLLFLLGILIGWIVIKFGPVDLINHSILAPKDNTAAYYQDKYERFELVDLILSEGYYDYEHIDQSYMVKDALKSYVNGIDDPYTIYMDADQNSWFMGSLEWEEEFEWIWAVVNKKDYYIQIEEVLKESPAFKSGLKPLDRIVTIEDEYVENETLDDAVSRMKWPAGTEVNMVIERFNKTGDREIFEKTIVREKINIPSVTSEILEVYSKRIW